MDDVTKLIEKFQALSKTKNEMLKKDEQIKDEILDRLKDMPKKEFFMSVVNTNPKNNKKFTYKYIQEGGDLNDFFKDSTILNGFFRFLPTYKEKRIVGLEENVEACAVIIRQIIEQFNPLIKNIISKNFLKKYSYISNNYNELYAGGINGLVSAIYKFDTKKGVKFITHAYRWIIYYIYREMDDIVKTYNDKLYDDDNFFDTLEVDDSFESSILNNVEVNKLKAMDIIDPYEEKLLEMVVVEKIRIEDITSTIQKLSDSINDNPEMFKHYIRA